MRHETDGVTLWFTGLPCSGKTTIAQAVKAQLEAQGAARVLGMLENQWSRRGAAMAA